MADFSAYRQRRVVKSDERVPMPETARPTKPKGDDRRKKRHAIRDEVMAEYKHRMKPITGIAAARG
jgi:hypothetical protein